MKKQTNPSINAQLLPITFISLWLLAVCVIPFTLAQRKSGNQSRQFPKAGMPSAKRTLTFAERVTYQRAIEEVYWRHRTWPKERPDPKPSLDAVISPAQLEKKVESYLRNSQALEDHWQRPITAQQLQAEMDRMARGTKQPEVLREVFEALGNDPFVVAECLARPALADRLVTSGYAYDERIHGQLKQRARAELELHHTVKQMKQLGDRYSEINFVRVKSSEEEANRSSEQAVKLNSREWDEFVQKLSATFGNRDAAAGVSPAKDRPPTRMKTGLLSPLQEDKAHYSATAVLSKTDDDIKLATVEWHKEPLESWLARTENRVSEAIAVPSATYGLPIIAGGGCRDDSWTATTGAPEIRDTHTAVWTGNEMIIWGGFPGFGSPVNTGGKYNPATDTWTATTTVGAPDARYAHTAVWTGSEMIVWGGRDNPDDMVSRYFNTGGRYNPVTDSWVATSTTNAPSGRTAHTAVWTGSEMVVWGGYSYDGGSHFLNTGGRYNPSTDSWVATSLVNVPERRYLHTAVWTGSEMIVYGGLDWIPQPIYLSSGARYNPVTDTWIATSQYAGRAKHSAVWTGSEMIIWGGQYNACTFWEGGARYDPGTDSWTAVSFTNAPTAREYHTAVWTGSEMIVWGGEQCPPVAPFNTGGRYNPTKDSWTATSTTNAPVGRANHTAVWTGKEMIVWGGGGDLNTGGRYDPSTDSWTSTGSNNAPEARETRTAVWTGSEMIIWGGANSNGALDTGGRYDPALDTWTATNTTNAPEARGSQSTVWTGSEMIIWGGFGGTTDLNTGGRYNPISDSWTPTSTTNAPAARAQHSAVWIGSEMIVWGGSGCGGNCNLNSGGRYNPTTDTWTPTSTINAPSARWEHTAVSTGSKMIVWGGTNQTIFLNSGGRYNPTDNTWTATTIVNAPVGRIAHTAVWTGSEMIVWGGGDINGNELNTGGRYNPTTDSWTFLGGGILGRDSHTAVWTGSEMIIWGGYTRTTSTTNTGGRYNPSTDNWTATSLIDAPIGRYSHTAVWTGSEMIVWGGRWSFGAFNTGGRYCAQSGPTPTPTATSTPTAIPSATPTPTLTATPTAAPRSSPAPRIRPTPAPRP